MFTLSKPSRPPPKIPTPALLATTTTGEQQDDGSDKRQDSKTDMSKTSAPPDGQISGSLFPDSALKQPVPGGSTLKQLAPIGGARLAVSQVPHVIFPRDAESIASEELSMASMVPLVSETPEYDLGYELNNMMFSDVDPNARQNAEKLPSPRNEIRGSYSIHENATTESEEADVHWAAALARRKYLAGFHDEVKGIYGGGRSASVSPCPAPFVTMFGNRPKGDVDLDEDVLHSEYEDNAAVLRSSKQPIFRVSGFSSGQHSDVLSQLYAAFKRADTSDDGYPTTSDIRATFLQDGIVHTIFNLEKRPRATVSEQKPGVKQTVQNNKDHPISITCNSNISSFFSSTTKRTSSTVFSQQFSRKPDQNTIRDTVCQFWKNMLQEWETPCFSEKENDSNKYVTKVEPPPSLLQSVWNMGKLLAQTAKGYWQVEDWEFTPSSQTKLNAILRKLRHVESEGVVRLSLRFTSNVKVGFPKYAQVFAPFVGSGLWVNQTATDDEPRQLLGEAQHRLIGASIGERMVRDGYLGTNMCQYEVKFPGRMVTPWTSHMEAPSCSAAARNKGGLPRIKYVPGEFDMTASEKELMKEKHEEIQGLMVQKREDFVRLTIEQIHLKSKIDQYNENRFVDYEPHLTPTSSLMTPPHEPFTYDHLNVLRVGKYAASQPRSTEKLNLSSDYPTLPSPTKPLLTETPRKPSMGTSEHRSHTSRPASLESPSWFDWANRPIPTDKERSGTFAQSYGTQQGSSGQDQYIQKSSHGIDGQTPSSQRARRASAFRDPLEEEQVLGKIHADQRQEEQWKLLPMNSLNLTQSTT